MRLRLTLLAVGLGLAVSLAASLLLPRLEYSWLDNMQLYYQDLALGHLPPDPRIVLVAKLEQGREAPADVRGAETFQPAGGAGPPGGGKPEDERYDWSAADDADLVTRFHRRGATGVCFRRPYTGDSPEELKQLAAACNKAQGLVGAHFLRAGQGDTHYFEPDLPPELREVSPQTTVDSRSDADGVNRRVYLALVRDGKPIPSAALVLYARLQDVPLEKIAYEPDGVRVGSVFFPCERDAEGYPYWVLWPVLDAASDQGEADIWNYPVSARKLLRERGHRLWQKAKSRAVFVGDMLNEAIDERSTPFGKMHRFQVQAALLNTLLANWSLRQVPAWQAALLQFLVFFMMSHRMAGQTHWLRRLLTAGLAATAWSTVAFVAFWNGLLLPLAGPLLGILTATGVVTLAQSSRALKALERYGGEAARLAGARMVESTFEPFERTATIMFTNLPDHLKDLERLNSPELFARRKEYSDVVIRIIKRHGGRILDFQADFIMTGFNVEAVREDADHALRAVRAALELEGEVGDLKDRWLEALDPAALKAYCGICTGLVAIGWVGAKEKQAPAAIGDTTNVAARLLGAGKKMGVDILVSEPTMQSGEGKIVAEPLPPVMLKGKTHPVAIFHATGLTE